MKNLMLKAQRHHFSARRFLCTLTPQTFVTEVNKLSEHTSSKEPPVPKAALTAPSQSKSRFIVFFNIPKSSPDISDSCSEKEVW